MKYYFTRISYELKALAKKKDYLKMFLKALTARYDLAVITDEQLKDLQKEAWNIFSNITGAESAPVIQIRKSDISFSQSSKTEFEQWGAAWKRLVMDDPTDRLRSRLLGLIDIYPIRRLGHDITIKQKKGGDK